MDSNRRSQDPADRRQCYEPTRRYQNAIVSHHCEHQRIINDDVLGGDDKHACGGDSGGGRKFGARKPRRPRQQLGLCPWGQPIK